MWAHRGPVAVAGYRHSPVDRPVNASAAYLFTTAECARDMRQQLRVRAEAALVGFGPPLGGGGVMYGKHPS